MNIGRWMGIDFGSKHIGVAICDELGMFAHPYTTLEAKPRDKLLATLLQIAGEEDVVGYVVGLPLNMNGTSGRAAQLVHEFVDELKLATPRPVELVDERLSSWEAEGKLIDAGLKPGKRKEKVHEAAAQIILRTFLDRRRTAQQAASKPPAQEE
ncbi:Putative pre-16S rRNA nuclease [Planctomycetaceae bacterium]|nr:Putative pre-16S rRNA nuclease [Planctomycetaceae bacterium]